MLPLCVFDDFLPDPDLVRESALRSGFGTWRPNKGDVGADSYGGVNFIGDHATPFRALHERIGPFVPTTMFFRITNPGMERALIHSDREYGERTAIVYLSQFHDGSGTAFYRHRSSGLEQMPALSELMRNRELFERIRTDMLSASDEDWEMIHFIEARFNRCLLFDAPLIHCRIPKNGYGSTDSDSRMVWVAHVNGVGNA